MVMKESEIFVRLGLGFIKERNNSKILLIESISSDGFESVVPNITERRIFVTNATESDIHEVDIILDWVLLSDI